MDFKIDKRVIKVEKDLIVGDNADYVAHFAFDEEWDGKTKTARFIRNGNYVDVLLEDDKCNIPVEVLKRGYVTVGVYSATMTTSQVDFIVKESIKEKEGNVAEPTPNVYEQLTGHLDDIQAQLPTEVQTYFNEHKDELKGDKGDTGERGEQGIQGVQGIQGEKGVVDYSLVANALKGAASGEVVRVDDISPVEHTVKVRVAGKNLCNGLLSKGYYTNAEMTLLPTESPIYRSFSLYLSKGVYTLSASANARMVRAVINGEHLNVTNLLPYTFSVDNDGIVGLSIRLEPSSDWDENITLQLEQGDTATEYAPYIEPTSVMVTRCGKNLFDKATIADRFVETAGYKKYKLTLPNGLYSWSLDNTFFNSGCYAIWTDDEMYTGETMLNNFMYQWIGNSGKESECPKSGTFEVTKGYVYLATTGATTGKITDFIDKFDTMQLESGGVVSGYETYKGETYTPIANGTLNIDSIAPTMTLLTDKNSVNIELEYNKDLNVVINDILSRLNQ